MLTSEEQVAAEFVSYFEGLLGGVRLQRTLFLEFLQPHLKHVLSEEEAASLTLPVSSWEIKEAFFCISKDSAPGPDGFTSAFFKAAWSEIGDEVSAAVQEFFVSGRLLKQLNATLLVLLPKVQLPTRVSEFRPIACCNVLYKAISKILVRRMQQVLHKLIDYSQNAFVPGRSIADNVLLAQELLSGYNQAKLPKRCTIKIDIQKAYDSVNWDFVDNARSKCFNFLNSLLFGLSSDIPSVSTVIKVLEEFAGLLGLQVNPGRAQLLKSVLGSLHIYWSSVFVLPKSIVKIIEQQMRVFLWKGVTGSGMAKVAWDQVCKPKEEGGLGIRRVLHVNQALILRHVWRLLQEDSISIWVAWVLRYWLRNQTIWSVNAASASWCWRKLVKISGLIKDGLEYRVGDGCKFRIWTDLWHPRGLLLCSSFFPCYLASAARWKALPSKACFILWLAILERFPPWTDFGVRRGANFVSCVEGSKWRLTAISSFNVLSRSVACNMLSNRSNFNGRTGGGRLISSGLHGGGGGDIC
ncbi:UNVERIFIED_CONTAM: putative mitochondrial protein [Sesamum radiatum]|uniref:Mitochondrial protein n=1 Tax=Sesamum radiatum TaxID=300843 RepID=A0AAW2QHL7_SESRA